MCTYIVEEKIILENDSTKFRTVFFFPQKEIENFKAKCYYFTKIEWWVHGHFLHHSLHISECKNAYLT